MTLPAYAAARKTQWLYRMNVEQRQAEVTECVYSDGPLLIHEWETHSDRSVNQSHSVDL